MNVKEKTMDDKEIRNKLVEMYKSSEERAKKQIEVYGWFRIPKQAHQFRVLIENDNLTEEEHLIFTQEVVWFHLQESFIGGNSNLLTLVIYDDVTNKVLQIIEKIKNCNIKIEYMDGIDKVVSTTYLTNCKLLFTRTGASYADVAVVEHKLIYSFENIVKHLF
jgi:hypothetical protein